MKPSMLVGEDDCDGCDDELEKHRMFIALYRYSLKTIIQEQPYTSIHLTSPITSKHQPAAEAHQ